jgi:hypothetical protein
VANRFHYQATQFFPQPELEVETATYPFFHAICYGAITALKSLEKKAVKTDIKQMQTNETEMLHSYLIAYFLL